MTTQKYDVRAIARAHQTEPHFLSCSRDGKLIMRRDEKGDYLLLAHDQETLVAMSAQDARDFALWVLMANVELCDGGTKKL
jgi:hypothetical protein